MWHISRPRFLESLFYFEYPLHSRHVTHVHESYYAYEQVMVMSRSSAGHEMLVNESCHTLQQVMAQVWMSHVTHMIVSRHCNNTATHRVSNLYAVTTCTLFRIFIHCNKLQQHCNNNATTLQDHYNTTATHWVSKLYGYHMYPSLNLHSLQHTATTLQQHCNNTATTLQQTGSASCLLLPHAPFFESGLLIKVMGVAVCCSALQCVAVCCSVLQYIAVCCSMLQYVAVCCSMLQCCGMWVCCVECVQHVAWVYVYSGCGTHMGV